MACNFFDLPIEIRQSIYDINNKKLELLKSQSEYNKKILFHQLYWEIADYEADFEYHGYDPNYDWFDEDRDETFYTYLQDTSFPLSYE